MNESGCEPIRDALPEYVAGTLGAEHARTVEAHVAECAECRGEMEIVRLLRESRPGAPAGLAFRVRGAIRFRRDAVSRPWWGIAAAAVAALAIGIGVVAERGAQVGVSVPAYASDPGQSEVWSDDDGLVAGAPVLDGLSDQALQQLLEEMGQWKKGA